MDIISRFNNSTNVHRKKHISRQRSNSSLVDRQNDITSRSDISNGNTRNKNHQTNEHKNDTLSSTKPPKNDNMTDAISINTRSKQKQSRHNREDIPVCKPTPDLDLFNLQIHQSDNDLEIISHRKTQKLISTDINSLIRGSASPVRGQPARHLRNGRKSNSG